MGVAAVVAGCRADSADCPRCATVVVAATGEPSHLLPPLVVETVGRDISDQVFEKLADLAPGAAPIDTTAFRPALADRWERVDSVSWRFHLRPGARWQDGRPVTAADVRFSFDAFGDSVFDAPARAYVEQVQVAAEDSATVLVRFPRPSPEQLYDATYHVRIIPEHIWGAIPHDRWPADTAIGHLIGSGPYRLAEWRRGEFVRLAADTAARAAADVPAIRTAIWRFTADPDAAINLVLGHEADLLETVGRPENAARAARDSTVRLLPYPSATYGFLGFHIRDLATTPVHPVFGDPATRRALAMAVDREALARSAFGREAKAPPGPMSQLLWIWDDRIHTLPFDTAAAARALDDAGWKRTDSTGTRRRGTKDLAFDILVPGTSPTRRQLGVALQAMWQAVGAAVTVSAVDFPVFQERLAKGRFDSYIGAWLDEPSPRGLAEQWTRAGWDALNYGHWSDPAFDTLFARAGRAGTVDSARALYRQAMDTLNAEAPAIFLYAPANVALVSRRLEGVEIDPYTWASGLRRWRAGR
jgi:peptide/nickel transport system substrate-binding protein